MGKRGGAASKNAYQEIAYRGESDRTDFDMICPKATDSYFQDTYGIKNWKKQWCIARIEFGSKCVTTCPIARELIEREGIKLWEEK